MSNQAAPMSLAAAMKASVSLMESTANVFVLPIQLEIIVKLINVLTWRVSMDISITTTASASAVRDIPEHTARRNCVL